MMFFAEKLLFDDKEKEKILNEQEKDNFNKFIRVNEQNKQVDEQIYKKFTELKKYIVKRENFKKFNNDIPNFLKNFIQKQQNNFKILKSNSQSVLRKRNWNDQNDFTNNLFENYEDLMKREIKRFIQPNLRN